MWPRALVILTTVAVLCGAPSSASAAGPNTLSSPVESPTSGTTGSDTPRAVRTSAGIAGMGGLPASAPREAMATPTDDATSIPTENAAGPVEIAVGLGGAAALALFAWLLVLAGRRRRTAPGSSPAANRIRGPAGTADEQVTATLYRRTLRRSKIRLDEDPIIASMGVEAADTKTRGRAARRSTRRSPPT